ncbi:dihydroorotate dehydrogenase electron transfer subunit [bacterium]|nr:dihydroorotate dehydrogenase electron transfer subunit [bacterium]
MENKTELPIVLEIKKVVEEAENTKTFYFDHTLNSKPGQFVMLWLPGVDEIPISVSFDDGEQFALTVFARGEASNQICGLKEGDKIGIRGPYGTMFNYAEGENLVLVGGGYGAAPLRFLANEAVKKNCKIDFMMAAKTKNKLLFVDELREMKNVTVYIATSDGSEGFKGHINETLEKVLKEKKINKIMTCGPELLMKAVGEIGDKANVQTQISIERYMKCGFGVCGQCVMDPLGIRTCVSGPVMNSKVLNMLEEFGKYRRDAEGRKQYFNK